MKTQSIHYRRIAPTLLIALALGCLTLSAAAQTGNPSIVGLWRVHYLSGGVEAFQSFEQFHSDGLEFEISNIFGLSCQGVFRQRADGSIKVFHTGWNFDENGNLTGYFNEVQINTVGPRGERYTGTWDIKNYDIHGNFLSEQKGTLRATRLTVE
jgi:hypothetical protein